VVHERLPQESWLADWQTLATRYSASRFTFNGKPTVIGVDLRNAPHLIAPANTAAACWTGDTATKGCQPAHCKELAHGGANGRNAILAINPNC